MLLIATIASGTALTMLPRTARRWQLLAAFMGPVLIGVALSFIYLGRLA